MPKDKLSQDYKAKFGSLTMRRGRDDDKKELFSWEPIPDCTDELCPMREKCKFVKRGNKEVNKCHVIAGIVRAAAINIISNFGKSINNAQRNRIGQHLMPLYVHLAKLNLYEASLASPNHLDFKGVTKMNTVYKDIRETIRAIDMQWKNIGLSDMKVDSAETGSWYENMEKSAQKEMMKRKKQTNNQTIKLVKLVKK